MKANNNIVFVTYLDESKIDCVFRYETIDLARDKFNEIEKTDIYKYLELGIDNVISPTEGTYDILQTYNILNIVDIVEKRWDKFYYKLKKEIKKEIREKNLVKEKQINSIYEEDKVARSLIELLLKDELPERIESNLSEGLLKYKNFKIKLLFNSKELEILSNLNLNLDIKYSLDFKTEIGDIYTKIKLRDNEIVSIVL